MEEGERGGRGGGGKKGDPQDLLSFIELLVYPLVVS